MLLLLLMASFSPRRFFSMNPMERLRRLREFLFGFLIFDCDWWRGSGEGGCGFELMIFWFVSREVFLACPFLKKDLLSLLLELMMKRVLFDWEYINIYNIYNCMWIFRENISMIIWSRNARRDKLESGGSREEWVRGHLMCFWTSAEKTLVRLMTKKNKVKRRDNRKRKLAVEKLFDKIALYIQITSHCNNLVLMVCIV